MFMYVCICLALFLSVTPRKENDRYKSVINKEVNI